MKVLLDNYQVNAIKIKEKNVLVVAAPGSGKTTVIINRVNYLIEERKARTRDIIVITFTKAAAENMKNRYKNTFSKTVSPFFGTFHGLFYKILLREGYKINIIESGKCHSIIRVILSKYFDDVNDDKIREVLNNISLFKTSLGNIENFKPTISNEIFKECYEQYEEYKAKEQLWDFDDLSIRVLYLLKNNERILNGYRGLFKYVLVDEFQDCDELQIEFIKLINQGNELFAVGDEDQCIYSFRGSKPKYMVDFHSSFKNGKKVYLTTNYRSKKNIVDISKKLICNNIGRNKKEIISYENEKGIIKFLKPYNEYVQGEEIANIIKKIVGESYSNNAILYRTNIEARSLIDSFTRRKIPFILLDKGYNFFEHFICKDIINYLTLSIDPFNKVAFNSIINKPFRYISKDNLNLIKDEPDFINSLINKCDLHPKQVKTINDLDIDISYVKGLNPKNAISYIRTTLDYDRYILDYCANRKIKTNGLIEILNELESSATNFKTIQEYLEHIERVKSEIVDNKNNKETDGVIFTTMHSAKGLEFKNVYIIGANEGTIPHEKSYEIDNEEKKNDQIEEERRLMYVAITRAEENICISSPINKYGKRVSKSRFVEDIKAPTKKEMDSITIGDRIYHKKFKEGTIVEKNGDSIKIRFKDRDRALNSKVCLTKRIIWKI